MDRWDQLRAAVQSVADELSELDELIVVIDHNDVLFAKARSAFSDHTVLANDGIQGLSGARNTGVEAASGDLVLFLDDDAEAEPGWMHEIAQPFIDPEVVGVGGFAEPAWHSGSAPPWMPDEFYWVVGCSYRGLPTAPAEIRNPIGCNMAFRRQPVLDAGGFSSDLGRVGSKPVGGEETDLSIRVLSQFGGRIMFAPGARVIHRVDGSRETWGYFVRRCYFEGRSKAVLAKRVGAGDATSSERAYLSTLAGGVISRLGKTIDERSSRYVAQIGALTAGLATTGAGFVVGAVGDRFRRQR